MSRFRHGVAALGVPILITLLLTGCGGGGNREAVAAAKCSLPVDQKAGFANDLAEKIGVDVTDLGECRYLVTGKTVDHLPSGESRGAEFVCQVAPDKRDKLRGFRITVLQVNPAHTM